MRKLYSTLFALLFAASAAQNDKGIFTVDSHCDTPYFFYNDWYDIAADNPRACIDIPKMRKGGLDGAFFAAFVAQGDLDSHTLQKKADEGFRLVNNIHKMAAEHADELAICTNSKEGYKAKEEGKIALYIGLENGTALGGKTENVDKYKDLGVRYITLVHTKHNDLCSSASDTTRTKRGLTPFGKEVIRRMNEQGVMVDVSHADESSAAQAIRLSSKPCIASHSSSAGVFDHPRNMSDTLVRLIASRGGVVQVCLLSDYLKSGKSIRAYNREIRQLATQYPAKMSDRERVAYEKEARKIFKKYAKTIANVKDAADHIDYIVDLVGIDYVGIGSDFDGGGAIAGYMDASGAKNLTRELRRRGYKDEDLAKIWSGNLMRVLEGNQ